MNVIDFNNPTATPLNDAINAALDAAAVVKEREKHPPSPDGFGETGRSGGTSRDYLGASAIGSECLRKVQFDWMRESVFPARTNRIFGRGHASEEKIAASLIDAGFLIERGSEACGFTAVDGCFQGHCDGIIHAGPAIAGLVCPCLWEHKCLGDSGWKKIEKHGLRAAYPVYEAQCQLYMAYLGVDENPALFTVENANTCHLLALTVAFDAVAAQAASDRAVSVIRATQAGELLPRITDKGPEDWRCKMCGHREYCWSLES